MTDVEINGIDFGAANVTNSRTLETKQIRHMMGDQTVRVREIDFTEDYATYTMQRLTTAMKDGLVQLVRAAGFSREGFIHVLDDEGREINGYIWNQRLTLKRRAGGFWSATFTIKRG